MSLEDPFFVVKDEVFKALNKTRGLYLRWRDLSSTNGAEVEWTTTELRNSLRSIEWDLEDLEDTIFIVEKNPNKFKIDNNELLIRRHFISTTRDEVKLMKEKMSLNRNKDRDITAHQPLLDNLNETKNQTATTPTTLITNSNNSGGNNIAINLVNTMSSSRYSGTKYSKLENSIDSPNHYITLNSPSHNFINENAAVQQRILYDQDEQINVLSDSIGTLKTVSRQIGVELDEQAVMLDDFGNELDTTESKLDSTIKKVAKVFYINNDSRQWIAIGILSTILLVVIILFTLL